MCVRGGDAAQTRRPVSAAALRNLVSASAFSVVGGSFYLWSMLLPSLRSTLGCSLASLSAVFAASTVCFTAGTSLGPSSLFGRRGVSVAGIVLLTSWASALGLLLSASVGVNSLPALALGYAGVFGLSSGVVYALNIKVSNAPGLFDGWQGRATGIIVSFRALGTPLLTPMVRWALGGHGGGARRALAYMAGAVVVLSLPIAALLSKTTWEDLGQERRSSTKEIPHKNLNRKEDSGSPHTRSLLLLWTCFLCGSFPGLLAHGHAGAMAAARGGEAAAGVTAMAAGSLLGRLGAGALLDARSPRACLVGAPLLAAAALACGAARRRSPAALTAALGGAGLCYGMNAVAIAVATARIVGARDFSRAYGLVFTAWGTGGVLAPVVAGYLYDRTGGYRAALVVATGAVLLAATAASFLPVTGATARVEEKTRQ